jgi:hypothetical protein
LPTWSRRWRCRRPGRASSPSSANNHRNEAIALVIRRRFSGDLLEGSGSPKCTLLEEGAYAVNRRQELVWALRLGPGEEQSLVYTYHVLVRN